MRSRVVALAVLASACSFEPGMFAMVTGDALDGSTVADMDGDTIVDASDNCPALANANQRDFDGDQRGDVCDPCPHIMAATPDGDGDGVGDACDPRPAMAGDQRVIFVGFYDAAEIAGWSNTQNLGMWSVQDHELVQTAGAFALLDSPFQYSDVYFATRIEAVNASATEVGFCGSNVPIGQQYYCCGVTSAGGGNTVRAASAWPGSGGQRADFPQAFAGSLAPGDTVDVVGTMTATTSHCTFSQGIVTVTSETPRGPAALGTAVFYTTAPARYHYGFVVAIGS